MVAAVTVAARATLRPVTSQMISSTAFMQAEGCTDSTRLPDWGAGVAVGAGVDAEEGVVEGVAPVDTEAEPVGVGVPVEEGVAVGGGRDTSPSMPGSATPTLAAATASTESAGATDSGIVMLEDARPGEDTSTVMLVGGDTPTPRMLAVAEPPVPASRFTAASVATSPTATIAARTMPRTTPWYAGWKGSRLPFRLAGSPFTVPSTMPGPAVTVKVITAEELATGTPAASTTVARSSATSAPSRYSAVPVPVEGEGASHARRRAVGVAQLYLVWFARTGPVGVARADIVTHPGAYVTPANATLPKEGMAAATPCSTPFTVRAT